MRKNGNPKWEVVRFYYLDELILSRLSGLFGGGGSAGSPRLESERCRVCVVELCAGAEEAGGVAVEGEAGEGHEVVHLERC